LPALITSFVDADSVSFTDLCLLLGGQFHSFSSYAHTSALVCGIVAYRFRLALPTCSFGIAELLCAVVPRSIREVAQHCIPPAAQELTPRSPASLRSAANHCLMKLPAPLLDESAASRFLCLSRVSDSTERSSFVIVWT